MKFEDLAKKQLELDQLIESKRSNGFTPRKKTENDILFAIDDEVQEWLKELPEELNFKVWKQRMYNRDRELEEFVDILFFLLQYANEIVQYTKADYIEFWINREENNSAVDENDLIYHIESFKNTLYEHNYNFDLKLLLLMSDYITLARIRGFSCSEVLDKYFRKRARNIERLENDWVISGWYPND